MLDKVGIAPNMLDLAQQLIALETTTEDYRDTRGSAELVVFEKLRRPLTILTGTAGFRSLLRRALTLATRQAQTLEGVQVQEDGSLKGLDGDGLSAAPILIAQLIGLLETFIGEALVLRLLHDAWPNLSVHEINSGKKE